MLSISTPDGNFDAYVAYPAQTPAPGGTNWEGGDPSGFA